MAEYSINSCIRTDKPQKQNGKYPIYLRVRVRDKETKLPANIDVRKVDWDKKRREPKDRALLTQLNRKVMDLDLNINRTLAEGHELTVELVKELHSGKRKPKREKESFYAYYLDFVERKRKEGLNESTLRVYMNTFSILKGFRKEFAISDLSLVFIEKFDDYLRDEKGNSPGGRLPKHKNIRTVVLDIEKHGIPVDNPYKWFKMPSADVKEVFLDKTEVKKLAEYIKRFDKQNKDYMLTQMYLFSCYSGLRLSDALDLRWKDIDFANGLIRKMMVKTKSEVIVPLFPMAKEILEDKANGRALYGSDEKVFPTYAEPTINQTVRKVAGLARIKKYLSYHSSRHTFATLLVVDGVDIYKIQKYLGHKSVTMTERYLKYDLSIAKESAKDINTFSGIGN